jgi:hypothetical protein
MQHLSIKGTIIAKNDPGFDQAIRATLFNKLETGRRPELMVIPEQVDDIIQAIRYAQTQGMHISVCSGGHSWSANHLRPGSILINMRQFNQFTVDAESLTATAGPAVGGSELLSRLMRQGLFFPAGHCKGVCIGGYLLQGGFAWNGRKLGLACESVIGLDIVTASGELVHASATENADLYWAARGSGGGFFGVVVRFHLRVYPKPKYCGMAMHAFDIRHFEEVHRWAYEVGPAVTDAVEFQMITSRKTMKIFGPGTEVLAVVFADSRDELEESTRFMKNSPIRKKAFFRTPFVPLSIDTMYSMAMTHYPEQHCWGVDNMWTRASIDDLMPGMKGLVADMPPAPAHMLWLNWQPPVKRQDMAFSMEDNIYIALYGSWKSPADTPKYQPWATNWMTKMENLATGIQLADENLHQRPARFVSDQHLTHLDAVRLKHDPQHLFNEWHSRPRLSR